MAKKADTTSVKGCWQEYRTPGNVRYHNDLLAVFKTALQKGKPKGDVAAAVAERSLNARFSARARLSVTHRLPGSTMPPPYYLPVGITGTFAMGGDKVAGHIDRISTSGAARPAEKSLPGYWVSGTRTDVGRIIGDAWDAYRAARGTDRAYIAGRTTRKRQQKAEAFAERTSFMAETFYGKSARPAMGMVYFAETGARVTLSGGAQG